MGTKTKIEWCGKTASPWHGCTKVAAGCQHCYAEKMSRRNPKTLGVWGDDGTRIKSKSFVKNLRRWNREAEARCEMVTVFPSICDPFEDRPELVPWREEMFAVLDECPYVTLLLLTKRPENVGDMWPVVGGAPDFSADLCGQTVYWYRHNAWIGTSIANQADTDRNLPLLVKCRDLSPVLFVSAEPLLGPVDLSAINCVPGELYDALRGQWRQSDIPGAENVAGPVYDRDAPRIDWLICGGESGPHARPMHPAWVRSLRDQCAAAGVPFFFKQWGEWLPFAARDMLPVNGVHAMSAYPDSTPVALVKQDGRVFRPYSFAEHAPGCEVARIGKKAAGRLLDGVEHSAFPKLTDDETQRHGEHGEEEHVREQGQ